MSLDRRADPLHTDDHKPRSTGSVVSVNENENHKAEIQQNSEL